MIPEIAGGDSGTTDVWFPKIPDKRFAFPGRWMGISLGDFGTTDRGILLRYRDNPLPVIPDLFRDLDSFRGLGLFRDLLKKAEI